MKREEFLAVVGDPDESLRAAVSLDEEALALWRTIGPELYTKAGKPRKGPVPRESREAEARVHALREEARALRDRAHKQKQAAADPWSHTRPEVLDTWGLHDVARRVREAHARFIAEAEAA